MRSTTKPPLKNEDGALTQNQVIQELTRSPHGDLKLYTPVGIRATKEHGEFYAHLIAWNRSKGAIRDSKVALPILNLAAGPVHEEFSGNALAHLATLDPRNLVRALRFSKEVKTPGYTHAIRRLIERYLRARESNWGKWERTAIQHRSTLKELYALGHVKPVSRAQDILFDGVYPPNSTFAVIANLRNLSPSDAAAEIIDRGIPFLIAAGALGAKAQDTDLLMALIGRMSPTELVTNMKRLERLGVKKVPALRAALEEALSKASGSTANVLKTTVAADAVEDEGIAEKLRGLQEKQIQKMAGIEGDWLVLGDRSSSMSTCIEASRHIAATLAKLVRGQVHLIFFNTSPQYMDATGKDYDTLLKMTRHVTANGGTHIGCGVQYAIDNKLAVGGIAIVSDGGENGTPPFVNRYREYVRQFEVEPTVYFYRLQGDADVLSKSLAAAEIQSQTFDVKGEDYYSLPNLVSTMRTNRYSLIDEIMATPLLTVERILGAA